MTKSYRDTVSGCKVFSTKQIQTDLNNDFRKQSYVNKFSMIKSSLYYPSHILDPLAFFRLSALSLHVQDS